MSWLLPGLAVIGGAVVCGLLFGVAALLWSHDGWTDDSRFITNRKEMYERLAAVETQLAKGRKKNGKQSV